MFDLRDIAGKVVYTINDNQLEHLRLNIEKYHWKSFDFCLVYRQMTDICILDLIALYNHLTGKE